MAQQHRPFEILIVDYNAAMTRCDSSDSLLTMCTLDGETEPSLGHVEVTTEGGSSKPVASRWDSGRRDSNSSSSCLSAVAALRRGSFDLGYDIQEEKSESCEPSTDAVCPSHLPLVFKNVGSSTAGQSRPNNGGRAPRLPRRKISFDTETPGRPHVVLPTTMGPSYQQLNIPFRKASRDMRASPSA